MQFVFSRFFMFKPKQNKSNINLPTEYKVYSHDHINVCGHEREVLMFNKDYVSFAQEEDMVFVFKDMIDKFLFNKSNDKIFCCILLKKDKKEKTIFEAPISGLYQLLRLSKAMKSLGYKNEILFM